jgi:hypothetical protein
MPATAKGELEPGLRGAVRAVIGPRWSLPLGRACGHAGPFIGLIVSPERIDGIWSPNVTHRWDFRRRLADGPRS